jgi:hypothetical protein
MSEMGWLRFSRGLAIQQTLNLNPILRLGSSGQSPWVSELQPHDHDRSSDGHSYNVYGHSGRNHSTTFTESTNHHDHLQDGHDHIMVTNTTMLTKSATTSDIMQNSGLLV